MTGVPLIYTIGHSNHPVEAFVALLREHGIEAVVDVRSQPYSQWASQFNRELLRNDLGEAGIAYDFMGDVIGGRPRDPSVYDAGQQRPDYKRVAQTAVYQQGIADLLVKARTQQIAVMCSEGDYHHCHRHLLISQTLLGEGVRVIHILPDGATSEATLEPEQLSFFT